MEKWERIYIDDVVWSGESVDLLETPLKKLFDLYLGVGSGYTQVRIFLRNGAIKIERC